MHATGKDALGGHSGFSRNAMPYCAGFLLIFLAGCSTTPQKDAVQKTPLSTTDTRSASLDALRGAVAADPRNVDLRYKLGNACFDLQKYDEALAEYDAAISLAPKHASAHANRALCLKRMGRLQESLESYRVALEMEPDDVVTLRNYALALESAGLWEDAASQWIRLSELQPEDVQIATHKAGTLFHLKRYEEAAKAFERVLHLDPGLADDYYNLGLCYFCIEKWDAALAAWLTALARDPRHPSANRGLATLYWKRGDYERAWEAVSQCRALGVPLDPEFIANLEKDSEQARGQKAGAGTLP